MKRPRFLNTVEKKYIVGYGIVGILAVVFMITTVCCNSYVSNRYTDAISELVTVNNLEASVERLNGNVNQTYIYLTENSVETYGQNREQVNKYLLETQTQLEGNFIREVMDAEKTVETYVEKSDALMEKLGEYLASSSRGDYESLESHYNDLQEIYSYVVLRFQNVYSVKLNVLSQMEEKLHLLQNNILVLQVALLVLALLGSIFYLTFVIREVSRSISTMRKGVEAIQKNVQEASPILIESGDEFEEFANAFNDMTRIIQSQMREIEENADIKERLAEMEIKNLRMFSELQKSHLDFLQSRVNPHFLFNTLNMISSLARMENADDCAELMEITASFLRYNLDNISKTVTLKKEVENLKEYVAIQEYRYGGRYAYHFDIEDRCLDFVMPCMILQPLVENAIQHGIAMKLKDGAVWIRVYQTEDRVCLEVRDNGEGMTEEQIRDIYEDFYENTSSGTHIGIRNIYRRLRLFYHDDVQFEFHNMDPGLKIFISLPREGLRK